MREQQKQDESYGVCVGNNENSSFIYLCGIKPVRNIKLSNNVVLMPAISSPNPDDMIDCIMKNGSGHEFELGLLIATLRQTSAVLKIDSDNAKSLAVETWNSQISCVQIAAILNCELAWYFQANESAENFNANTRVSVIYPNMYKFPTELTTITEEKCLYIEDNLSVALELDADERFSTASNALWSYKHNPRPAIQLSIIWGGIESLFLIERGIKRTLSAAASRFLIGNDDMVDEIKRLYEARCKAVHELKNSPNALLDSSSKLLHNLILKCIEQRRLPNVDNLLAL